jgi:hypothetical protein
MGMTYVCEKCGASLHGVNAHVCGTPLVATFNIHQDCLDEPKLREQIAKEIEAKCLSKKHDVEDQDVQNSPPAICSECAEIANLVRNPNV